MSRAYTTTITTNYVEKDWDELTEDERNELVDMYKEEYGGDIEDIERDVSDWAYRDACERMKNAIGLSKYCYFPSGGKKYLPFESDAWGNVFFSGMNVELYSKAGDIHVNYDSIEDGVGDICVCVDYVYIDSTTAEDGATVDNINLEMYPLYKESMSATAKEHYDYSGLDEARVRELPEVRAYMEEIVADVNVFLQECRDAIKDYESEIEYDTLRETAEEIQMNDAYYRIEGRPALFIVKNGREDLIGLADE